MSTKPWNETRRNKQINSFA